MSNTTCFELKIQCPPSQSCLQTISLFTSLFTRESESESDSGHQKYIVDFQCFPVSLTKYVPSNNGQNVCSDLISYFLLVKSCFK